MRPRMAKWIKYIIVPFMLGEERSFLRLSCLLKMKHSSIGILNKWRESSKIIYLK